MMIIRIALFITMLSAILVMLVNGFILTLPDWVIRVDGILMLVLIVFTTYFTSERIKRFQD